MMKKNAKKNLKLVGIIVVLIAVIFVVLKYVGVPLPLKKTVTASYVVIGEESVEPVKVTFDGTLRLFVGDANRFKGEIKIEGWPETEGAAAEAVGYDGIYAVSYGVSEGSLMGIMMTDTMFFRDFVIQMTDGVIFGDGKTVFIYPEVTADELDEKIAGFRKSVGWQESMLTEGAAE